MQKQGICFSFVFLFYLSHSPCRKNKIFDRFSTQKRAIFGQIFNSTTYVYIYAAGCLIEPHFSQCHETCENVVRNEKTKKRRISGCHFWGSIAHPVHEAAFLVSSGFALPGTPAASEKSTVFGNALSRADNGLCRLCHLEARQFFFCTFLLGGGGRSPRSGSTSSRAQKTKQKKQKQKKKKKKKKKRREEEQQPKRKKQQQEGKDEEGRYKKVTLALQFLQQGF